MSTYLISLIILTTFSNDPTYREVKSIFENRCGQCHNQYWPDKNWLDYETAKKHKVHIKHKLLDYSMPPSNNTNMTEEERKLIIKWIDSGALK